MTSFNVTTASQDVAAGGDVWLFTHTAGTANVFLERRDAAPEVLRPGGSVSLNATTTVTARTSAGTATIDVADYAPAGGGGLQALRVTLADSTRDFLGLITVNDDGSPTASWPDRLAFYFSHQTNGPTRTGYFNEYGEVRARPAKTSTVALRCQEHASGSSGDIFQVTNPSNVPYFSVSNTAVVSTLPVRAPNTSVDAVRVTDSAAVNANTTVAADAQLTLSLEASSTYIVEGVIVYDCSTTADLKLQFQTSSAPTLCSIALLCLTTAATNNTNSVNYARRTNDSNFAIGGAGVGTALAVDFRGIVQTNAATTFAVAYAQNTSDPTDLVMKAGTHISARKIRTT